MQAASFLVGQMLIAMPAIGDPRFERSLVLICAHDGEHAMGIAVNHPVEGMTVSGLLKQLDVPCSETPRTEQVLLGGPVETERGFVLHTGDYPPDEHSLVIGPDLILSGTRDALATLSSPVSPPRRALLALGYAGWGPGQLEREIRDNVWLTVDGDEDLIFAERTELKWTRALSRLGIDPGFLAAEAGRA